MQYVMERTDEAKAKLKALPEAIRSEIGKRLHLLERLFVGDVKKLKGSKNGYRLRVGHYRVLFELTGSARSLGWRHHVASTVDAPKTFAESVSSESGDYDACNAARTSDSRSTAPAAASPAAKSSRARVGLKPACSSIASACACRAGTSARG